MPTGFPRSGGITCTAVAAAQSVAPWQICKLKHCVGDAATASERRIEEAGAVRVCGCSVAVFSWRRKCAPLELV